jgi:lysophospholipase L1-like esterase
MTHLFIFGDSLTAADWPERMQALLPAWRVSKNGLGGRVLGERPFDPGGSPIPPLHPLNGRHAFPAILAEAGAPNAVLIMLGTNDAQLKTIAHEGGAPGAARGLAAILACVDAHAAALGTPIRKLVVNPPPFGPVLNDWSIPKLGDNPNAYLAGLVPLLAETAAAHGARFLDLYATLAPEIAAIIGDDGVHFGDAGNQRLAEVIGAWVSG